MSTNVGTLQSKLTLDFSQFSSGMNSAISLVRSFGRQLQQALGSNATQGFSTTNRAINTLQASIVNLQSAASNFQATMVNLNTTLAQFSNVQATTANMVQTITNAVSALQSAATNMQNAAASLQRATNAAQGAATSTGTASRNAKELSYHLDEAQRFALHLKRILGGIVVSQAFYRILGIMRDLVNSSTEFMLNMEQSAIAFKYLLGSAENSKGFLEALQNFAITSPMDMSGAITASRLLMTMGFEAESTIGVLRTLTDAATVAGGELADTVNRISLALGQMLQSGTVKMQEVRQLVNANIPIFDILQEELGLTSQQLATIGDQSIDSSKAVTAILIGLQKRFSGASTEMQTTITGALSATKDSFYVMFNEIMAGPFERFRQKTVQLSEAINYLANVARQHGAGGVFEVLIPEKLHMIIRNVIGAFMQLGSAIKFLGLIVTEVFKGMGEIMVRILSIILPPLTIALNGVLQFTYGLMRAFPIIKYFAAAIGLLVIIKPIGLIFIWFWKVLGLSKIIDSVVFLIKKLIIALKTLAIVIISHHMIAFISAVTIAVLALTGVLQKAINKFKEFFSFLGASFDKTLNKSMGIGYNPNDILQPIDKDTKLSADKYNQSLTDIASHLSDIGKEATKTKNKLKDGFNQSFDEVFTINPNASSDLGLGNLKDLDLSGPIGDIGDFSSALSDLGDFDFGSDWVDKFMISWREMWEKIKERIKDYGIPALLAALGVGLLTKNPWAALAAALATLFWPELCKALGVSQTDGNRMLGQVIGAILGGVIGNLIGGPGGAAIGAAIGFLCGDVMGLIMNGFQTGVWDYTAIGSGIGTAIGAAIGLIAGGPAGGLIGAAIGLLIGYIGGALVDGFKNGNWDVEGLSTAIGGGVGAAIGFIVGGPAGAAIGAVIGYLVVWLVNKFATADWSAVGDAFTQGLFGQGGLFGWSTTIFSWAGDFFETAIEAFKNKDWASFGIAILEGIMAGLLGAVMFIIEPIARLFDAIVEAICEIFGIHSPAETMKPLGANILFGLLEGILSVMSSIPEYIASAGNALITAIGNWFVGIGAKVTNWFSDAKNSISTFVTNTSNNFTTWVRNCSDRFDEFTTDTRTRVVTWSSDTASNISTWVSNTRNGISSWASSVRSTFSNWWAGVRITFDSFKAVSFTNWCSNTLSTISNWCTDVYSSIKEKIGNAISKVKEFLGLSGSSGNISVNANVSGGAIGHANGGVFNREHWAKFNENNKAEAIIPLETRSGMQPFVDAVSDGITATLAPILSSMNNSGSQQLQPLYVGTLIADERSLKELERKMEIIRIQEGRR